MSEIWESPNAFEAYLRQGKKGREVLDQVLVERAARAAYDDYLASDDFWPCEQCGDSHAGLHLSEAWSSAADTLDTLMDEYQEISAVLGEMLGV